MLFRVGVAVDLETMSSDSNGVKLAGYDADLYVDGGSIASTTNDIDRIARLPDVTLN